MPFRVIRLKPGVDIEQSPVLNQFQLTASNLIRFYAGLVQKLGGWIQITLQTFVGVCRGLHAWADIVGNNYIGIGTDQRLQVYSGGKIFDITPLIATNNPAVDFSTVINTPIVTITDATTSPTAGDWINLLTQVSIGGIVLQGYYPVTAVVDATHYTVTAASNATATVNNGGAVPVFATVNTQTAVTVTLNDHGLVAGGVFTVYVSTTVATVVINGSYSVIARLNANNFTITGGGAANATTSGAENAGNARIQYLLPSGPAADAGLTGYGAGDYGAGDYGGSSGGVTVAHLRQWALDNFGQDLIASPSNGGIYYWQPPTVQPAALVAGSAPTKNTWVFVIPQAQIIMAIGAEIGGTQQPLLVRWCDAGDFTAWVAAANNQAGSYSIPSGSMLIGGIASGLGATIWTDQDVWSVTYIGFPLVFSFNPVATGCGLIAPRAAGVAGTLIMWLGLHQFFRYHIGAGVEAIECSVWDFYWYNTDQTQFGQYHCAVNTNFNEFAWFFPIATTSPLYNPLAPLGYVKYNYVENCWDYGLSSQYQRTAWTGHAPIGSPIGADLAGLLQQHEQGFDANGSAMLWSWMTGYFPIGEGEDYMFSDLLIPDFVVIGTPTFVPTILSTEFPNQPPTVVSVSSFTSDTLSVTYNARGREIAFGMAGGSGDVGTFSRLGAIRIRYSPDGCGP